MMQSNSNICSDAHAPTASTRKGRGALRFCYTWLACLCLMACSTQYNINGDSLKSTNDNSFSKSTLCEKMTVRNTSGTFTASFVYGNMPNIYGTLSVPSGWLIPLRYINLGRLASDEDRLAHVKIIVPHNQGQPNATSNVYACFYDIVYQRGN